MLGTPYERFVSVSDDYSILPEEDVIRFILATDTDNATLPRASQCGPNTGQQIKYIVNDTTSSFTLTVVVQSGDTSVGNLSLPPGRGVFCISNGQLQWTVIGGAGAGGAGSVTESDFSFSDITTANATSAIHGLMPKLTPGVATASQPVTLGATKNLDTLALDALTGNDASLGVTGLAAAQGGAIVLTGGTSSTSGNAGGAVSHVGGVPGATGVGGAASIAGGAGGATSGAGGVASITGGAGTAGNAAGGVASAIGGAGQGSAAGGVGKVVGGAGGATGAGGAAQLTGGVGGATSGTGGAVAIAGGAGTNGGASGGAVTINGGALNGGGANGTVTIQSAYAPVAGGGTSAAILCTSTAALGIYFGTGTPTFSAAKGSLYIKTDASTSATRLYIATDAVGGWTAYTSAA
jgi:hypothetical protein